MSKSASVSIIDDIYARIQSASKKGLTSFEILSSCNNYKRDTVYRSLYRLVHEGSVAKSKKTRKSEHGMKNTVYVAV